MKKLNLVIIASLLFSPLAKADVMTYLKKYGLPCAASLAGGMALADKQQTGVAIGISACLGIGTATYINDKMNENREISKEEILKITEIVNAKSDENNKALDSKIKAIEEVQKNQIEDMRAVIREVIADRMLKMEENLKADVSKKLESGEFMPKLEQNISSMIKGQVVSEVKSRQKEIVEKCVEKTISEVVQKPIGVPENSSGISDEVPAQEQ